MHWFNNFKLKTKLTVSNSVLALLIIVLAGISVSGLNRIGTNVDDVNKDMEAINNLLQADRDLYQALVAERSMIFTKVDSAEFLEMVKAHTENIEQGRNRVAKFRGLMTDSTLDSHYTAYDNYRKEWESLTNQIRAERESDTRQGRRTAIDLSFGDAAVAFDQMRDQIDQMTEFVESKARAEAASTSASVKNAKQAIFVIAIVSLLVVIAIAVLIPRLIVTPVKEMIRRVTELAGGGGDLTQKLEIRHRDEVGQLGEAVNSFIDSLRDLLSRIIKLGEQLEAQTDTLSDSAERNNKVAEGASQQVEMLATSITEMSASVQEVAQNAAGAAEQSKVASDESQSGQNVVVATKTAINELATEVQEAAEAITKLNQDTTNIDAVVNVIQGIAEQTNLLALNAAIEAARAGEQGRGFAVVADEVRALASRTQESTMEIQKMIADLQNSAGKASGFMEKSQTLSDIAVERAGQAGVSLEQVNSAISKMSDMNVQIAAAAEEQSSVAAEISENSNQFSEFSNESSTLSDQVRQASDSMTVVANELSHQLANFKV